MIHSQGRCAAMWPDCDADRGIGSDKWRLSKACCLASKHSVEKMMTPPANHDMHISYLEPGGASTAISCTERGAWTWRGDGRYPLTATPPGLVSCRRVIRGLPQLDTGRLQWCSAIRRGDSWKPGSSRVEKFTHQVSHMCGKTFQARASPLWPTAVKWGSGCIEQSLRGKAASLRAT